MHAVSWAVETMPGYTEMLLLVNSWERISLLKQEAPSWRVLFITVVWLPVQLSDQGPSVLSPKHLAVSLGISCLPQTLTLDISRTILPPEKHRKGGRRQHWEGVRKGSMASGSHKPDSLPPTTPLLSSWPPCTFFVNYFHCSHHAFKYICLRSLSQRGFV